MMTAALTLWWGGPELADRYRADMLHAADRARAGHARSPRAEQDWRVSRALLQQVRSDWPADASPALSLSHSRGYAVVGTAPSGWHLGVDLEAIRPRDTDGVAQWCCTEEERAALAACGSAAARLRAFYQLWTLKESFIKAANLDFPADMRSIGLAPGQSSSGLPCASSPWQGWRLRAPAPGWHAWSAVVDDAWSVSAVWLPARGADHRRDRADGAVIPVWRAARGAASPRIVPAGQWP
ncbi:4'-phosphopantetheinyl transferase family protein [Bordetella genomosp. 11]|uniref:4'-phosphopantetheinyl transferase domain-containing protein n=1 Tax=Bordetella genomosp. 11 TaxID=1416808 RepID=A0A261UDV0_9BORD|nr:4'-phosphopantetheinyl transferase superfamily protein [Bordetella genomosp. 11]OZI60084.1 hypothetical protein CAL28_11480 [Bordetella genomosp. 11]